MVMDELVKKPTPNLQTLLMSLDQSFLSLNHALSVSTTAC
jgi:hypothetical protein